MREQILTYLNRAIAFYNEINLVHSAKLPQNILADAKHTIDRDIPRHATNFITIINMVEQSQKYPTINSIQDAVAVFSNTDLDASIDKANEDVNVIAVGGNSTDMSAKEILNYSRDAIRSGVELLQLQIAAAKLSN